MIVDIIDFATQVGVDEWLALNRPTIPYRATMGELEFVCNEIDGIRYRHMGAVLYPFPSASDPAFLLANEFIVQAIEQAKAHSYRRWFPVYAVVPGNSNSQAWLRRTLESKKPCLGIKLWPYMGKFSLTDFACDESLCALVKQHNLLVFVHVGTGCEIETRPAFAKVAADPATAIQMIESLPEIDFVLGHAVRLSERALIRCQHLDNAHIDISGVSSLGVLYEGEVALLPARDSVKLALMTPPQVITALVEDFKLGSKLLFGTAWPYCGAWGSNMATEIDLILSCSLSKMQCYKIFVKNAMALIKTHGVNLPQK